MVWLIFLNCCHVRGERKWQWSPIRKPNQGHGDLGREVEIWVMLYWFWARQDGKSGMKMMFSGGQNGWFGYRTEEKKCPLSNRVWWWADEFNWKCLLIVLHEMSGRQYGSRRSPSWRLTLGVYSEPTIYLSHLNRYDHFRNDFTERRNPAAQ